MTLAFANAEAILRSRLGEPTKTGDVVGFTTLSGKAIAIFREASETRIWFQPPEPPKLEGVRLMSSPSTETSSISGPLRESTTLRAEVDSRDALNQFLDWYLGSALRIDYVGLNFPTSYMIGSGTLSTSWDEVLWAAVTIGRPSTYHVFRFGQASFNEAIFRLALVRMAVEQDLNGFLRRTNAFAALDPTEKGMVSYFLGMTICKLFSSRLLLAPWLLHLDVFRSVLNPAIQGRSRPDLVGEDINGDWHAFESKGRSSVPSSADETKAKAQAQRLVSLGGIKCALHVGSLAFFRSDVIELYWRDPEPDLQDTIELPRPEAEWRYYYEPALSLTGDPDSELMATERALADVTVRIHPKIRELLQGGEWLKAKLLATDLHHELISEGFQPDGIKLTAGASWTKPYEPGEHD
jgi:hypothetical protein